MTKHWTQEQIDHEKQILQNQLLHHSGRFALFVLRTYAYILWECRSNQEEWCLASKINGRRFIAYVYNGPQDHMGRAVVEDAKDKLKKMGYIAYRKVDNVWRVYIRKPIDFCDLAQYVTDTPDEPDFYERVYRHLLQNGIKIYTYPTVCWKCHKETPVYTYLLSRQLEEEMGADYAPRYHERENTGRFEVLGVGSNQVLDAYLMTLYPQIQMRYSQRMQERYPMCCCTSCGAHQGINFTVFRPKTLMHEKWRSSLRVDRIIDIQTAKIDKETIKEFY